jgi:alpha-tubulin suppressor-like RCC1 family protein
MRNFQNNYYLLIIAFSLMITIVGCDDNSVDSCTGDGCVADTNWKSISSGRNFSCGIKKGNLYCWGDNIYGQLGLNDNLFRYFPTKVDADNTWTEISVGNAYGCGIKNRTLYCWGSNIEGQLGDGSTINRLMPVQVGMSSNWSNISAGTSHACGILDGKLHCWGNNNNGQIGNGNNTDIHAPVQVEVENDWTHVSAGESHTCAIRNSELYCWGYNSRGQTGNQTTSNTPVKVGIENTWEDIDCGGIHSCGILSGALYCWGGNYFGQLGIGTNSDQTSPVRVGAFTDWQSVSSSTVHTCSIRNKELYCWGSNDGQLGIGSLDGTNIPVSVGGLSNWQTITTGVYNTCGIESSSLYCWGSYEGSIPDSIHNSDINIISPTVYDEIPGVMIFGEFSSFLHEGQSTSLYITLKTEPAATVAIPLHTDDSERLTLSATELVFTPENWSIEQHITVTAVDNEIFDGDATPFIIFDPAVSTDSDYDSFVIELLYLNVINDDEAGISLSYSQSEFSNLIEGSSRTFSLVLSSQPVGNVEIPLVSSDPLNLELSESSLIFTAENWSSEQTVTVTAIDDDFEEDSLDYTIHLGASISNDPSFSGWESSIEGIVILSNDEADISLLYSQNEFSNLIEGSSRTFSLVLTSQPVGNVEIPLVSSDPLNLELSESSLIFTSENWGSEQTVTVTAVDDETEESSLNYTIHLGASISNDPNFSGWESSINAAILSNDGGIVGSIIQGNGLSNCILTTNGTAECWGDNEFGQIGDDSVIDRTFPTPVIMPANRTFTSITMGGTFVCAIDDIGNAWCWGKNNYGQVGDNSGVNKHIPTAVAMPANRTFISISGGGAHACALDDLNNAWCWGYGWNGQLGENSSDDQYAPVPTIMPSGRTFSQLIAGGSFTFAIDDLGNVWSWGYNGYGQLGNGGTSYRPTPSTIIMPSGRTFVSLSIGVFHTCAIDDLGNGWCWGLNDDGQLGDDSSTDRYIPKAVEMPANRTFQSIDPGHLHTCAIDDLGNAWCWGTNVSGQLGDTTYISSNTPKAISMPSGATFNYLNSGYYHTCAMNNDNIWCWGQNIKGQLGDTTIINKNIPTPIY